MGMGGDGTLPAVEKSPYAQKQVFVDGKGNRVQLVSMFGRQPVSHRPSAATHVFGTSTRDQTLKMYISQEHSKQVFGVNSPGPVYQMPGCLGKQTPSMKESSPVYSFGSVDRFQLGKDQMHQYCVETNKHENAAGVGPGAYESSSACGKQAESGRKTMAKFSFGTGTRDQQAKVYNSREHEDAFAGLSSPGPGVFAGKSSVGAQVSSTQPTSGTAKFAKQNRFRYEYERRAAALPGAGAYVQTVAIGKQPNSRNQTMPKYGFGSSTRDNASKVFISKTHEKSSGGKEGPGPQAYESRSGIGRQVEARQKSHACWGFGTETRFKMNFTGSGELPAWSPAPGAYNI